VKSSLDFQKPDGALHKNNLGCAGLFQFFEHRALKLIIFGKRSNIARVVRIDSETIDQVAKIPIIVIIEGSYVRHNFPWRFLPA
jgi:hypothetical protein